MSHPVADILLIPVSSRATLPDSPRIFPARGRRGEKKGHNRCACTTGTRRASPRSWRWAGLCRAGLPHPTSKRRRTCRSRRHGPSADEKGGVTGLRAAYIVAVQSGAGEEYHAERGASGEAVLVHPPQRFAATLDGARVLVTQDEEDGWELTLATTAVGCEARPGALLPAGVVEASKNRVHMSRGDVEEWYVNGPLGLEQGFTLERAPSCAGTKVVSIEVGGDLVPGPRPRRREREGHRRHVLQPRRRRCRARYSDLHVKDARGKILDAWMTLAGTTIELHVDDAEAVYPIEIDPLVAAQSQKLTARRRAGATTSSASRRPSPGTPPSSAPGKRTPRGPTRARPTCS
jgi:hypothetical protein